MRLADFENGIVPGVKWPKLRSDNEGLSQIQRWIANGKLVCHGNSTPNPLMDLLQLAEVKKPVEVPRATELKTVVHKPIKRTEGAKGSWPYQCGQFRRAADDHEGVKTKNPCVGEVGERWQAGYDGKPEPARKEA